MSVNMTPFFRNVLILDAAVSGIAALFMAAGANILGPFFDLPVAFLRWVGIALLPFVLLLFVISQGDRVNAGLMKSIVALNALWVVGSILILVAGWVSPNPLGYGFVLAQAVVVAVFAVLQGMGLRQSMHETRPARA